MYQLIRLAAIVLLLVIVLCGVMLVLAFQPLSYWVVAGLIVLYMSKRGYGYLSAYGTARWAMLDDLKEAGMVNSGQGLIIGRLPPPKVTMWPAVRKLLNPKKSSKEVCQAIADICPGSQKMPLVWLNPVHTVVFSPTGGGKGVSCVVPHLLTCPDSMVVIDFKGENARLTAEHRRKLFGHRIVYLDPFKIVTPAPDTFCPFDFIDPDSQASLDDCRDLAESLVIRGEEKEKHWLDGAETFIGAMSAAIVNFGQPGDRSLQTLRALLTDPKKMEAAKAMMKASTKWNGILTRLAGQLDPFIDRELASTLTTTNRFMRFLDTPLIAENTKSSTFDPMDLNQGKMTVYLILPPDHMRTQSPLLRMWIGAMLRAVVKGGLQESNKVRFELDEAGSLGRMDCLTDALTMFRGYGVRLHYYLQDVAQLKKCFPEGQDQTLLSNTSQVFFGVNDYPTAEYVSNRLGEETITATSWGTSDGTSNQISTNGDQSRTYSSNTSENTQQLARKLLKPEEVLALPQRTAITFTPGVPPIKTTLIRYYEEKSFTEGWMEVFKLAGKSLVVLFIYLLATGAVAMATTQICVMRLCPPIQSQQVESKNP